MVDDRLATTELKRFCTAPMSARAVLIAVSAPSIASIALSAPLTVEMSRAAKPVVAVPATAVIVAVPNVRPVRVSVVASLAEVPPITTAVPDAAVRVSAPAALVAVTPVCAVLALIAVRTAAPWVVGSVPAVTAPTSIPLMVRSPAANAPVAAAVPLVDELPVTEVQLPSAEDLALTMLKTLIVSPWFAPTWNAWLVNEPLSSLVPLNEVSLETRSISAFSCWASAFSAARSVAELVALRDCTASSRMRCRLLPISPIAPSAVCDSEMPSLALRAAWSMPRIWVVKRSEMARPAASSLALLMRRPEDRRCRLVASSAPDADRLRCALSDITLVLMDCMVAISWKVGPAATRGLAGLQGVGWMPSPLL